MIFLSFSIEKEWKIILQIRWSSILKKIKDRDIDLIFSQEDEFRAERLYSIGLIGMSFKALTYQNIKNGQINNGRTISPLGKQFCEIVL